LLIWEEKWGYSETGKRLTERKRFAMDTEGSVYYVAESEWESFVARMP